MNLFRIAEQIERLLADPAVLDTETGELSPEGETALDALSASLEDRVRDVAAYIVGERTEAEAVQAQAKRLQERAARHDRRADSLERYLARVLTPGSQRIADDRVEVSWRRSTAVNVTNEEELADAWWRVKTTREPDKAKLRDAMKSGCVVPGAELVTRWHLKVS